MGFFLSFGVIYGLFSFWPAGQLVQFGQLLCSIQAT